MVKTTYCHACFEPLWKYERIICSKCGKDYCERHIGQQPDESNEAITKNAPLLCVKCF